MLQNRCDVHTHTLYSRHAYSTIRENVLAARAAGLELLGNTDHFSDMLFPGASPTHADCRDYQHFINMGIWPRDWEGVRVLHGMEADLCGLDGSLFGQGITVDVNVTGAPLGRPETLFDRCTGACDYVIASVHNPGFACGASLERTTGMYLAALAQPRVLVLGHTGRAGVPFDVTEVVAEAARRHKLIEINDHSLQVASRDGRTWETCSRIARACAEQGCQVAVSTDSHVCTSIGHVPLALRLLEDVGFPQELVATRSRDAFLAAMADAGMPVDAE